MSVADKWRLICLFNVAMLCTVHPTDESKKIRNVQQKTRKEINEICSNQGHSVVDKKTAECQSGHQLVGICCVKCHICDPGYEKDRNVDVKCFASCKPCPQDHPRKYYSNRHSFHGTEKCSQCIYCDRIYRIFVRNCTPEQNAECGGCIEGYMPISTPDNSQQPCTQDPKYENPDIEHINSRGQNNTEQMIKDNTEFDQVKTSNGKPNGMTLPVVVITLIVAVVVVVLSLTCVIYKKCGRRFTESRISKANSVKSNETLSEEVDNLLEKGKLPNATTCSDNKECRINFNSSENEPADSLGALPSEVVNSGTDRTFAVPTNQEIETPSRGFQFNYPVVEPNNHDQAPANMLFSVEPITLSSEEQNSLSTVEEPTELKTPVEVKSPGHYNSGRGTQNPETFPSIAEADNSKRKRNKSRTDSVFENLAEADNSKRKRNKSRTDSVFENLGSRDNSSRDLIGSTDPPSTPMDRENPRTDRPIFRRSFSEPIKRAKTVLEKSIATQPMYFDNGKNHNKMHSKDNGSKLKKSIHEMEPAEKVLFIKNKTCSLGLRRIPNEIKEKIADHLDADGENPSHVKTRQHFAEKMGKNHAKAKTYKNTTDLMRDLETKVTKFSKVVDALYDIERYDIISDVAELIDTNVFFH